MHPSNHTDYGNISNNYNKYNQSTNTTININYNTDRNKDFVLMLGDLQDLLDGNARKEDELLAKARDVNDEMVDK